MLNYHILFYVMEIICTIAFGISGALSAAQKNLDIVGIVLTAFVVGVGGGTIRDLLLNRGDVFWIMDPNYVLATAIPGSLIFILARYIHHYRKLLLYADAFGLGISVIVGSQKTLHLGYSPIIAVVMGMISGVGGGIIRDILHNEVPVVMRRDLYATAALLGALLFVGFSIYSKNNVLSGIVCASCIIIIRVAAINWHLNLPTFQTINRDKQKD